MTRKDFKKIIKLMSYWKIDKRKGNYILPNRKRLDNYLTNLIDDFLTKMSLGLLNNGDIASNLGNLLVPEFKDNEKYDDEIHYERIKQLVNEMIY